MTEPKSSTAKIATPTSGVELKRLIRTLPEEQGLQLLREHWSLLLPEDRGMWSRGLVGAPTEKASLAKIPLLTRERGSFSLVESVRKQAG